MTPEEATRQARALMQRSGVQHAEDCDLDEDCTCGAVETVVHQIIAGLLQQIEVLEVDVEELRAALLRIDVRLSRLLTQMAERMGAK